MILAIHRKTFKRLIQIFWFVLLDLYYNILIKEFNQRNTNTAYKQWRAFGGAMVCASHNCSCIWRGDRLELRHCSYAKTL